MSRMLAGLLAVLALGVAAGRAQSYTAVDLGNLGGSQASAISKGINTAGTVVGYSSAAGNIPTAFSYRAGVMTKLVLPGSVSLATAINSAGTIVGMYTPSGGGENMFIYGSANANGTATVTVFGSGEANAINAAGTVVGNVGDVSYPFSYSNGRLTNLGSLGGSGGSGEGINSAGTIVGYSYTAGGQEHAFSYSNGAMTDLGTLGGTTSIAYGINDAGTIVGDATTAAGYRHAFVFSNAVMTDLGTLGGASSEALAINGSGAIVGWAATAGNAGGDAFLFEGGVMSDLNDLVSLPGVLLISANAINDLGQIAATGNNGHGYLLTPVTPGAGDTPALPTGALAVLAGMFLAIGIRFLPIARHPRARGSR